MVTWRRIIAPLLLYGAILVGIYYHRHPMRIGPPHEVERVAAGFASQGGRASAALLLNDANGDARTWEALSPDAAWGNFLEQEVGAFELLDPAAVASGAAELDGLALVVLPEGVRPGPGEALFDTLDAWMRRGGILIVDNGEPGAYGAAKPKGIAGRVTRFEPGLVDSATAQGIRDTPLELPTREAALPAPAPRDGVRHLVMAGAESATAPGEPLVSAITLGSGGAISLAFPFARHLLRWQQGLPSGDLSIPLRWRHEAGVSLRQTNELVAEKAFLTTEFPHADAFERLIMAAVETIHPVPRLWYFPAAYDGAYCMTHDDEDFGDRSRALTEEEHRQGFGSTMFIIPRRVTAAGVAGMHADGAEIALHWWRGWSSSMERPLGLFGWTPIRQALPLAEQKKILEERSPGLTVTANRVHGLIWTPDYTRDFRRLEAAGFTLDSTYGPAGPEQIGYLFGTGFPFHPIDRNGRAFALLEMPFLYQDDENWDAGIDERLLAASRDSWHEVVTPLYHTTTMYWNPSVAVIEGFLAAAGRARAADHWVVPMGAYLDFWRSRANAGCRRAGPGFVPAASPDTALALMVPEGWRLVTGDGDGAVVRPEPLRRVNLMGRAYALAPLDRVPNEFRFERVAEPAR